MKLIDLLQIFAADIETSALQLQDAVRNAWSYEGVDLLRDNFLSEGASCLFIRAHGDVTPDVSIRLAGDYRLRRSGGSGGWLLQPVAKGQSVLWVPHLPVLRTLDACGRITAETEASLAGLAIGDGETSANLIVGPGQILDCVIWKFDPAEPGSIGAEPSREFFNTQVIERQPFFIYASHTTIRCAADFYQHLIHGIVFGACWAWPKRRKICDELDALALHMIAVALQRATEKRIYHLLRRQIVLAVLQRQDEDGGFRHGEWTEEYESHNRLINGAAQLFANEFELAPEPAVRQALKRATAYISQQVDHTSAGAWLLHDSLERSEEGMRHYPFGWLRSRWMGKSPTNLLILNTHIDGMLTLARYRSVCGDNAHDALFSSAENCLRELLSARPADWIFRPLLAMIALSLLPRAEQQRLPPAMRALKRLGWRYLAPRWHKILRFFPRLLMPGGYIERSLGQAGFAHRYHGVHLMDFERLLGCEAVDPQDPQLKAICNGLVDFGIRSHVTLHWKESATSKDTLGFWAEGLYRRCLRTRAEEDLELLATAILDLHDAGLGLPPSLLGANCESVPPELATPTLSPTDERLWVVNLSDRDGARFLVVNTSSTDAPLIFETAPWHADINLCSSGITPARRWTLLTTA